MMKLLALIPYVVSEVILASGWICTTLIGDTRGLPELRALDQFFIRCFGGLSSFLERLGILIETGENSWAEPPEDEA